TWNLATLRQRLGATKLRYKRSASHQHPDFHQSTLAAMFAREEAPFSELLDAITTGPREERARRIFTGDEQFVLERRDGVTRENPELSALYADVELPALVP